MTHSTPPCPPSEIVERWRKRFPEKTPVAVAARVYTSPRQQAQLRLAANFAAKDCGKWADEMADKGLARPSRTKP